MSLSNTVNLYYTVYLKRYVLIIHARVVFCRLEMNYFLVKFYDFKHFQAIYVHIILNRNIHSFAVLNLVYLV